MNWNQLYTSATPKEREEFILITLQRIEAKHNAIVFSRGRLIRERRGAFRGAHFLNDRRRRLTPRPLFLGGFMVTLATVSIGIWISFFNLPPVYAAPLMLFHLVALSTILIVRPRKLNFAPS
jgi:hypothetical protein